MPKHYHIRHGEAYPMGDLNADHIWGEVRRRQHPEPVQVSGMLSTPLIRHHDHRLEAYQHEVSPNYLFQCFRIPGDCTVYTVDYLQSLDNPNRYSADVFKSEVEWVDDSILEQMS